MAVKKILICLDTDPQPSAFDSVVAIDAGADHLLRYGGVTPAGVRNLVYGAIFTRASADLVNTALFIGGSELAAGERVLDEVRHTFFGPMRVSVMLDSSGANTTAAAAVLTARRHVALAGTTATVLAATGPVGCRVVRLLAREGAHVRVASRRLDRARHVCDSIHELLPDASLEPVETGDAGSLRAAVDGAAVLVAAGGAGVELLPADVRAACQSLQVAVDLNAVPPAGLGGVEPQDKGADRDGQTCYGAIGVGGVKMKLHRTAIARLFEAGDLVLDAEETYELGKSLPL